MANIAVELPLVQILTAYPSSTRPAFAPFRANRFEGRFTLTLGPQSFKSVLFALDTFSDLTAIPVGLFHWLKIPVPTPPPHQPRRLSDFACDFAYSFPQINSPQFATKGLIMNSTRKTVRLALRDVICFFDLTFQKQPTQKLLLTLKRASERPVSPP